MFGLLALAFLIVPIVELYVIIQVAGGIGTLETIGLLILMSLIGAALVRAQGLGVMRRLQQRLGERSMPTNEVVDGVLILVAGALLLTPGFVTDAVGVLLLLPPTRIPLRMLLIRRYRGRVTATTVGGAAFRGPFRGPFDGAIFDASASDTTAGDTTAGDTTAGDTTAGDTTAGDTTAGDSTRSGPDAAAGQPMLPPDRGPLA